MHRYRKIGFISLSILFLTLAGCARVGRPSGGPKDEKPPVIVQAKPPFEALHFKEKTITLYFDEYVQLKDLHRNLIVSPPMKHALEITPLGTASKFIRIKISDTLKPNTTYTIHFGDALRDFTEGNVLRDFSYVFSTGAQIDSLTLTGKLLPTDFARKPEDVLAMLYKADENYTDSLPLRQKPYYVTRTGEDGIFEFHHLAAGTYHLIALRDVQPNYRYDPPSEPIGFVSGYIELPTDSIYPVQLFYPNPEPGISHIKTVSPDHFLIGYRGSERPVVEEVKDTGGVLEFLTVESKVSDTLHLWTRTPAKDSIYVRFRLSGDSFIMPKRIIPVHTSDSLEIKLQTTVIPESQDSLYITASVPLEKVDMTKIYLMKTDSTTTGCTAQTGKLHHLVLRCGEQEPGSYGLYLLPGALTTFNGLKNDSVRLAFQVKGKEYFGELVLNIDKLAHPAILQLIEKTSGKTKREKYLEKPGEVLFRYLPKGEYRVKFLVDINKNRRWDTGDFMEGKQPEPVYYYPQNIRIKPNWTVRQNISL